METESEISGVVQRSWSIRGHGGLLLGVEGSLLFMWFVYFLALGLGMGCPFPRGGFVLFRV